MKILFLFLFTFNFLSVASIEARADHHTNNLPAVKPLSRFEERLRKFQYGDVFLDKTSDVALFFSSENLRGISMQLEALCKIYEESDLDKKDLKRIQDFHKEIKQYEDDMGEFNLRKEIFKIAKEINVDKEEPNSIDPKVIVYLDEQQKNAERVALIFLKKNGWLPDPKLKVEQLLSDLSKINFYKPKKDQREVAKYYLGIARKIHKKVKKLSPYIYKSEYSVEDLESGTHEFRRSIRWMTIIIQSLRGAFAYSDQVDPDPEFEILNEKFSDNKYFKLAEASHGHIKMDKFPYLRLSKLITDVGALKDTKEAELYLAEAFLKTQVAKDQKEATAMAIAVMLKKYGRLNIEKSSQDLYEYYLTKDPIKTIIENLENGIGNN